MKHVVENLDCGIYHSPEWVKEKLTPLRKASKYEIEFFTTADGTSFVDGKGYEHNKGNVLISHPGQMRQSIGCFECHFVKFECGDSEFEEKYLSVLPQVIRTSDVLHFCSVIDDIIEAVAEERYGSELYIEGKIFQLVSELYRISRSQLSIDPKYVEYELMIYEASRFILENAGRRITLSDIAGITHFSPAYFHKLFRKIVGVTPSKYLLDVRMKNAKIMLLTTEKPLSDIAFECGFESQVYMNYIFKKEIDMTPREYREKGKKLVL